MQLSDIEKPLLHVSKEWNIKWNEFYGIRPDEADLIVGFPDGDSSWDYYFSDTLLTIENTTKGLLLDVGWYPAKDRSGAYVALLLRRDVDQKPDHSYNWDSPEKQLTTRDPNAVLEFVKEIVS